MTYEAYVVVLHVLAWDWLVQANSLVQAKKWMNEHDQVVMLQNYTHFLLCPINQMCIIGQKIERSWSDKKEMSMSLFPNKLLGFLMYDSNIPRWMTLENDKNLDIDYKQSFNILDGMNQ